ncbi:MAG: amino acid transporter ATPase [Acidimicrobiales bacterium]|nr:amino acid transporter ATPase [Acidimicrobiales bacterium]
MLEVQSLHAFRGDTKVLHGVSLRVDEGELVALIGRNGMGKTTLLRSILNLARVSEGRVLMDGQEITRAPTHAIARRGIGVVPEGRGIFPSLKVAENLRMGLPRGGGHDEALTRVYDRFPLLRERARDHAGNLSGGQQQMLAIARALISRPRLLLIDEFSEGIQPNVVQEIAEMLQALNADGVAILLVEQNARLALGMAARGYILERGTVVAQGAGAELLHDEAALAQHLVV